MMDFVLKLKLCFSTADSEPKNFKVEKENCSWGFVSEHAKQVVSSPFGLISNC